jgi:hypothetical protein
MVLEVPVDLAQVTAEVSLLALPPVRMRWDIVKVVRVLILLNCHQARVTHMVALAQILVTLHPIIADDFNGLNLKGWVLEVLEWALIVVPAEHQITADNPLALILHVINQ